MSRMARAALGELRELPKLGERGLAPEEREALRAAVDQRRRERCGISRFVTKAAIIPVAEGDPRVPFPSCYDA